MHAQLALNHLPSQTLALILYSANYSVIPVKHLVFHSDLICNCMLCFGNVMCWMCEVLNSCTIE